MKTIQALEDKLNSIESFIPFLEKRNTKVSKVTVGWQLDHSLKVINSVITTMGKSDVNKFKNNFKWIGKLLFFFNYFPRGKAKAPKHVVATEPILEKDLKAQLTLARENIKLLSTFDEKAHFNHFLFRHIDKKRVPAFLNTHTDHHLKIVKSIVNS